MMVKASFYDPETGSLVDRHFTGPEHALEANTPEGTRAIRGHYDHRSQRVSLKTGKVIGYTPPAPDGDYERRVERRRALRQIKALELKQHRRVRELLAESDPRLQEIESEIAALRRDLQG